MTPELIIGSPCCSSILNILRVCEKDVGGSHLGEHVPDARTLAVLVPGALNLVEMENDFCVEKSLCYLIGSCGRSPEEVIRKGIKEQLLLRTVGKSKSKAAQ